MSGTVANRRHAEADPRTESASIQKGLDAYLEHIRSLTSGFVVSVGVVHEHGISRILTEVHGGRNGTRRTVLSEAELGAHRAARKRGGTASFVFELFDLDAGESTPHDPPYLALL